MWTQHGIILLGAAGETPGATARGWRRATTGDWRDARRAANWSLEPGPAHARRAMHRHNLIPFDFNKIGSKQNAFRPRYGRAQMQMPVFLMTYKNMKDLLNSSFNVASKYEWRRKQYFYRCLICVECARLMLQCMFKLFLIFSFFFQISLPYRDRFSDNLKFYALLNKKWSRYKNMK